MPNPTKKAIGGEVESGDRTLRRGRFAPAPALSHSPLLRGGRGGGAIAYLMGVERIKYRAKSKKYRTWYRTKNPYGTRGTGLYRVFSNLLYRRKGDMRKEGAYIYV